jgi:hypothetical protein
MLHLLAILLASLLSAFQAPAQGRHNVTSVPKQTVASPQSTAPALPPVTDATSGLDPWG